MAKYQPEEQIMTPAEHAIALQQHSQQYPLARINNAMNTTREAFSQAWDAVEVAVEQNDPAPVQEALKVVWNEMQAVYNTGVEYQRGFTGSMALSASLAERMERMVIQLLDPDLSPADRLPEIQAFAEHVEAEAHQEALEMMFENAADSMVAAPTWDINRDDAKTFIVFLLTGQLETSTFRVLGQMLPQLEARMQAIGTRK